MTLDVQCNDPWNDLTALLGQLESQHGRLLELTEDKLSAVRRNDLLRMVEIERAQRRLAAEIRSTEQARRKRVETLAGTWGLNEKAAGRLTLKELASRASAPQAQALTERGAALRLAMARLARTNRLTSSVCREVLHHLRAVFASVRESLALAAGYSGSGVAVASSGRPLFDTIG